MSTVSATLSTTAATTQAAAAWRKGGGDVIAGLADVLIDQRADRFISTPVGNNVGLWGDPSRTQEDQANDAKRPLLVADIGDNMPGVLFDGVDQFQSTASPVTVQGTYVEWLLFANLDNAARGMMIEHGPTADASDGHLFFLDGGVGDTTRITYRRTDRDTKTATAVVSEFFDGTMVLARIERGATFADMKLFSNNAQVAMTDGTNLATPAATTATMYSGGRFGNTLFGNFYKRQRCLISPIPDVATIAAVENQIRAAWSVY